VTGRDDLEVGNVEQASLHQCVEVAHPGFQRQASTEIERGARRCMDVGLSR
jgi:hypothetical protein